MDRRRLARIGFLGTLAVVLLLNVFNLGRNAESRPYRLASDSMYASARDSSVHVTFGFYHYLRRYIPGSRLTIESNLRRHVWHLRRISRLDLEIVPSVAEIETRVVRRLRPKATRQLWLRGPDTVHDVYFFYEEGADHYVLAPQRDANALVMMPEPMYRALVSAH